MDGIRLFEWMARHETALWWAATLSIVACAAGLIIAPWWAIRMPADFYLRPESSQKAAKDAVSPRPFKLWALIMVRNLIGRLFILAGLSMLLLPGQGILAILAGVLVIEFRAKHRVARAILLRPTVLHSLNWMRRKAGKPALRVHA